MADLPRLPGIPSVSPVKDPTIAAILRPMKESIEILGNTISSTPFPNTSIVTSGLGSGFSGGIPSSSSYDPTTDYTPPPVPTGFSISAAFTNVILTWDKPVYINHAYTEIWRSATTSFAAAVLQGFCPGAVYADPVGTSKTYYYWIRHVSQANVDGPYNSSVGTVGGTGLVGGVDLSDLIITSQKLADSAVTNGKINDAAVTTTKIANLAVGNAAIANLAVTNGKIADLAVDNAKIANLDAAKITTGYLDAARINAGSIDAKIANLDAAVISSGYINAARINSASIANASISTAQITSGYIDAARINSASISNANITAAQITSGYIDAARINTASISNATIGAAHITTGTIGGDISSSGFSPGSSGWKIYQAGNAEFNGVVISRQLEVANGYVGAGANIGYGWSSWDLDTGYSPGSWSSTATLVAVVSPGYSLYGNVYGYWNNIYPELWSEVTVMTHIWRWTDPATIRLSIRAITQNGTSGASGFAYYTVTSGFLWRLYLVT